MVVHDGCPAPSSKQKKSFQISLHAPPFVSTNSNNQGEQVLYLFKIKKSLGFGWIWPNILQIADLKLNKEPARFDYWNLCSQMGGHAEICERILLFIFWLKMVLGTHHGSPWPETGFWVRNERTCLTPQALAGTKINGLWTCLDNHLMKNSVKTSKSATHAMPTDPTTFRLFQGLGFRVQGFSARSPRSLYAMHIHPS
jgi:hypothetical protein